MIKPTNFKTTLNGIEGLTIKSNINSFLKKPVELLLTEVTSAFEGKCNLDKTIIYIELDGMIYAYCKYNTLAWRSHMVGSMYIQYEVVCGESLVPDAQLPLAVRELYALMSEATS